MDKVNLGLFYLGLWIEKRALHISRLRPICTRIKSTLEIGKRCIPNQSRAVLWFVFWILSCLVFSSWISNFISTCINRLALFGSTSFKMSPLVSCFVFTTRGLCQGCGTAVVGTASLGCMVGCYRGVHQINLFSESLLVCICFLPLDTSATA